LPAAPIGADWFQLLGPKGQARSKLHALPAPVQETMRVSVVAGSPQDAVAYYQMLVEAGMRYFIPTLLGNDVETLRLLAREVIPALRAA
jgi:hypothetical protein